MQKLTILGLFLSCSEIHNVLGFWDYKWNPKPQPELTPTPTTFGLGNELVQPRQPPPWGPWDPRPRQTPDLLVNF